MQIVKRLMQIDGVINAAILIGTEQNKASLRLTTLLTDEIMSATPNDLFFVVEAISLEKARKAVEMAEELVSTQSVYSREEDEGARTLTSALQRLPDANLALISIPGPFVKREAMKAIDANLNLFIFSNNVSITDEVEIKQLGRKKRLLVMGPDCGTAIIGGVSIGFANSVRKGSIGIVGAAGTGIQEVTSLIHRNGEGITQAIGTGSNDVTAEVGAITMIEGLARLGEDPDTKTIVLVSKPPELAAQVKVLETVKSCNKPVVICFLGGDEALIRSAGAIPAVTLEDAALEAISTVTGHKVERSSFSIGYDKALSIAREESEGLVDTQRYVRGLFSGGSLASESAITLANLFGRIYTNTDLKSAVKLQYAHKSIEHACFDLGANEFTIGKPHPILEPSMRENKLMQEAKDPQTAVILLDFVLGYGAHPDPVGSFTSSIVRARALAKAKGRYLPVVASVCGTDEDPQNRSLQIKKLDAIGVITMPSNVQATKMSALIALRGNMEGVSWRQMQ